MCSVLCADHVCVGRDALLGAWLCLLLMMRTRVHNRAQTRLCVLTRRSSPERLALDWRAGEPVVDVLRDVLQCAGLDVQSEL